MLVLMVIMMGQSSLAQQECGTPYSKDPYLDRGRLEQYIRQGRSAGDVVRLPVIARIVRHDDGTGGIAPGKLQPIFDTLNARFAQANIEFYQCGSPEFVDVNVFYDFNRDLYADSLVTYNLPEVINVYFINKVLSDDDFICGYASFPWRDTEYVVVKNSCAQNGSTLAHELGHYLGLLHTHETANGFELADGSNCTFTGDEICDTPADPRLRTSTVSTACAYVGTERDLNRDRYNPDPSNIMSYSRKQCRHFFSMEQIARMHYYLDRDRSHLGCSITHARDNAPSEVKVYPVPATHELTVEWGTVAPVQIRVFDLLGHEISISPRYDALQAQIDFSGVMPGLYVVTIYQDRDRVSRLISIARN